MKHLFTLLFAVCIIAFPAMSQTLQAPTISANSTVETVKHDGDNVYIGGSFSQVGFVTNYHSILPIGQDYPAFDLASPNSTVNYATPDGEGGWYIAGSFYQINGENQTRVAHILSDQTLDPDFEVPLNSTANSLTIDGDFLYIGGSFTNTDGIEVARLIRVDKTSGVLDNSWIPQINNGQILKIYVSTDSVHVGGTFSLAEGVNNNRYYAVISKTSGNIIPSISVNSTVHDLLLDGENLYLSGSFTQSSIFRSYLTSFDLDSSTPNYEFSDVNSSVQTIIPDGEGGWYISGYFTQFGTAAVQRLIHISENGTLDTDFSPVVNSTTRAMFVEGDDLYIGGQFTQVNGETVNRIARLDKTDGTLDNTWTPSFNSTVSSILVNNGDVYVGGSFNTVNGSNESRYFAILDAVTGEAFQTKSPNSTVNKIISNGPLVYLAGSFSGFGYLHQYIAMTMSDSGKPIASFPDANSTIIINKPDGEGGWYVGGNFTVLGNTNVQRIAHILSDYSIDEDFECLINSTVENIHIDGDDLYVCGAFNSINGVTVSRIARVNKNTGALDESWIPSTNSTVLTVNSDENNVYIGGYFTVVNGDVNTRYMAAIDKSSGNLVQMYSANNIVIEIAPSADDKMLFAGAFTQVGDYIPYLAFIENENDLRPSFSNPLSANSTIERIIDDGSGGYYIGGNFSLINGESYNRLAHINSDGTLDPTFTPTINSTVLDIVLDGNDLYISGSFTNVNGSPVGRIARIDASTGLLDTDFTPLFNSTVRSMVIFDGNIYVGGQFTTADASSRQYLAAVDEDGNLLDWNPEANSTVEIITSDASVIYAGGSFTTLSGNPAPRLASINPISGDENAVDFGAINNTVHDIEFFEGDLLIGGSFTNINGTEKRGVARLNSATGDLIDFDLTINSGNVYGMNISGNDLVVFGAFTSVNDEVRTNIAEFNLTTETLKDRAFKPNSYVYDVVQNGNQLLMGGAFTYLNLENITRVVEINTTDLTKTDLNLNINSTVEDVQVIGNTMYLAGSFSFIDGIPRKRLASYDLNTNMLNSLSLDINNSVYTFDINGDNIYIGGAFSQVEDETRIYGAAIDLTDGSLKEWSPLANSVLYDIEAGENEVLICGAFTEIGSETQSKLTSYNHDNETFTQLIPGNTNGTIYELKRYNDDLFIGGNFSSIGGEPRPYIAQYDLNQAAFVELDLTPNSAVYTIDKQGDNLFLGGVFTQVNSEPRGYAASFDLSEQELNEWNPQFSYIVNDIVSDGNQIICGGEFTQINTGNNSRIMAINLSNGELNNFEGNNIAGTVVDMEFYGDQLFLGGSFYSINGMSRTYLASIDKSTGELSDFDPGTINNQVRSIHIEGDELYFGGYFTEIDGIERQRAASFDLITENLQDYNPRFNSNVEFVSSDGTNIFYGGSFTFTNFELRNRFAAYNRLTNEILPLGESLSFNGTIYEIEFDENNIYVGGSFTTAQAGITRNRLASFLKSDGSVNDFDPNVMGSWVASIEIVGDDLYLGGLFSSVSGESRSHLASVNSQTGALNSLNISLNNYVLDLEAYNDQLFFGGVFTLVDGNSRGRLASINLSDFSLTDFEAESNSTVEKFTFSDNLLYVGGSFSSIGGEPRARLASLSPIDGSATSWAPALNSTVHNIFIEENYLFAGGSFTTLDGETVSRLVLLDKSTGENIFGFAPAINSTIQGLYYSDEVLSIGGSFSIIGNNRNHYYLASFHVPPPGTSTFTVNLVSTTEIGEFDIACNGDNTGEIEISVVGGEGPYSYTLTNSNNSVTRVGTLENSTSTALESSLPAGNYNIAVQDNADGVANGSLLLTEPDNELNAALQVENPITTEGGSEGIISLTITGGNGPFTYSYTQDGNAAITGSIEDLTDPTLFSELTAGTYVFSIEDANGCSDNASIGLDEYINFTIDFTLWNGISCSDDNDGRLRIQAFDGIPPYTYELDASDDTYDRTGSLNYNGAAIFESNLGEGTYSITVMDQTGVEIADGDLTITNPTPIVITLGIESPISSIGGNDGELSIQIEGGEAPYSYSVYNTDVYQGGGSSATGIDIVFSNLSAGSITVNVNDQNGCTTVSAPLELPDGNDLCADLGGDSDGDGICDDNDPCPLLPNLQNGDDCGINGTVVDCECAESCNLVLGTPIVECASNTNEDDDYTVSIFYSGSAPGAVLSVSGIFGCDNENIIISGDDPSTNPTGTIVLTVNESETCWGLSIQSDLCDFEINGTSPECVLPPCGISLGAAIVVCVTNTVEEDEFIVSIPYSGMAPGATVTVGDSPLCTNSNIAISGDDPTTNFNGTIVLASNDSESCWSIQIESETCSILLEGDAPVCEPGADCPSLGLNNGDPCGAGGVGLVVDCECLLPDCNGDIGGTVVDSDDDGICDDVDNCISTPNDTQEDLDEDNIGDACDEDIDGDEIANADDCDPFDAAVGEATIWFADSDGDGYGTDEILLGCTQPDGYAPLPGDCDDTNSDINPDSQTLSFLGSGAFTDVMVSPLIGGPGQPYTFTVVYTDATNALPPLGFPRLYIDYNGDGIIGGGFDQIALMYQEDINDLNTMDGKTYSTTLNLDQAGTDYQTSVQIISNGCVTAEFGPFDYPDIFTSPDLEIFADDITFSNPNPDVSSELTVFANIHNISDFDATNFSVELINQYTPDIEYDDILIPFLAANMSMQISWTITTPDEPAWCPIEINVDNTNAIDETNELDNSAVRPFTNGPFNVPGGIAVTATASPATQFTSPFATVTIYGYANYFDTSIPLDDPSVAGATVILESPVTNQTFVGNTNSQGFFNITVPTSFIAGIYQITGSVTDFTLTGDFAVTFELIDPSCLPDLTAHVNINQSSIFVGESVDGTVLITNIGCEATTESVLLDITQSDGTPLIQDVMVPPLGIGEEYILPFTDIVMNNIGNQTICGLVNADYTIEEAYYGNNNDCDVVFVKPPLPDIRIYSSRPIINQYLCLNPSPIQFSFDNIGYVPTGSFTVEYQILFNGAEAATFSLEVDNLDPGEGMSVISPFIIDEIGQYTTNIQCDIPMPEGIVEEISELNNTASYINNILECMPDLVVLGCGYFAAEPEDVPFPGDVTYTAPVRNQGNATAFGPIEFDFTTSSGETYSLSYPDDIVPNEVVDFSTTVASIAPATALLTGHVDPNNAIAEFSENNQYSDSLCWDFSPVPVCGYGNFWNGTYFPSQATNLNVGLIQKFLYQASELEVKFEVSGPGIAGTVDLGNASIEHVKKTCGCPYQVTHPTPFIFGAPGDYTFTITTDPDNVYTECNESNNVMVITVTVLDPNAVAPDMRILSEYINPTLLNPEIGESVFFNVTYENIGTTTLGQTMDLSLLIDEVPFDFQANVPGLVPGQNTTVAFALPYSSDLPGAHVVRAIIDSNDEISEVNESNNEATRALVVGSAANLYFEVFQADDSSPAIGQFLTVDATIANNGDLDTDADVLFSYITNAQDTVLISTTPISVEANSQIEIQLPWPAVLDNNTQLLGEIANASEIEFDYTDNFASDELGAFDIAFEVSLTCAEDTEGSITASASGGTAPYTYNWNNGTSGPVLEGGLGTYSVTVVDSDGFESSASESITEDPECLIPVCTLTPVSFNVDDTCDPITGLYTATVTLAYTNAPDIGFLEVNGELFGITVSPQTFSFEMTEGPVVFDASFTEADGCQVMVVTGITLTPCEQDCADVYGGTAYFDDCDVCDDNPNNDNETCADCMGIPNGTALPGTICSIGGTEGVWSEDCECISTSSAFASLLELECGGQVIQITGALAGDNGGGGATADTRTIYAFAPDNGADSPTYAGASWPYVIIESNLVVSADITGTLELNGDGVLLVNGWPAYQFVGDANSDEANGTFGPWSYFLENGDQSQDACPEEFDCPILEANIGDACDDEDEMTENDMVNSNCACEGTPIIVWDCPLLEANIGDECDDGNDDLIPGIINENCECIEQFDCPELMANIGDACDDGNPDTEDDVVNASCNCAGTPIVPSDCEDWALYMNNNLGGETDVFGVDISSGDAMLTWIATVEYQGHIAFNPENNLIYVINNMNASFVTVDPLTGFVSGSVFLDMDIASITTAAFAPNGKLLMGTMTEDVIYSVDLSPAVPAVTVFDSFAPINGGDIAFDSAGVLYLATRSGNGFYKVYPDDVMADELIGTIPSLVTGMALTDSEQMIMSHKANSDLLLRNLDGTDAEVSYPLMLNGEAYAHADGDMTSGCFTGFPCCPSPCFAFSMFYVDHEVGGNGSLYGVSFTATDANLSLLTTVDFPAHIGYNATDDELYLVNPDGSFIRGYNPTTEVFLGDLPITGLPDVVSLVAVVYNSADGLLYVGDMEEGKLYTIDLGSGAATFFADAPVNGGDLSIQDGTLYLAGRTDNKLYEIAGGVAVEIGLIPVQVNGMAQANSPAPTDLIIANNYASVFTKVNAADASVVATYAVMLGGSSFTCSNGDMAAGCADDADGNGSGFAEENNVLLDAGMSTISSFPNPTNGLSQVVFVTAETGRALLEVYDVNGRNVTTLFNQEAQANMNYRIDFNGSSLPNGVYIYKLTTNKETIIDKFMIAR